MSGYQKQLHCKNCQRMTLHVKADMGMPVSNIIGMSLLSVITCGLFLPIAFIWAIIDGIQRGGQKFMCQTCGQKAR